MSEYYDTFFAPLASVVSIRQLTSEKASSFYLENEDLDEYDFKIRALTTCVADFNTKVMPTLSDLGEGDRLDALERLYKACISLNPNINWVEWAGLLGATRKPLESEIGTNKTKPEESGTITPFRADHGELATTLKNRVVGQDEVIDQVTSILKRAHAGLTDEGRPLAVLLFAGVSGVGKTLLAKEIHNFISGGGYRMVRIDGGEYQHKHENQKLIGSPPGYAGHEEGGRLSDPLKENPHTVVLIDEVEKAHVDILNTFLRVFDEGVLTDSRGEEIDFSQAVIIMTTNLGSKDVLESKESMTGFSSGSKGEGLVSRDAMQSATMRSIKKHFTPELLNRVDSVLVFNELDLDAYERIAELELGRLAEKMAKQGHRLVWSEDIPGVIAQSTRSTRYGAREAERFRRKELEVELAHLLLSEEHKRGTTFQIVFSEGRTRVLTQKKTQASK